MVLPTYLPYFFYVPFFGKFYVQSALLKKKIPCPFSVLDKNTIVLLSWVGRGIRSLYLEPRLHKQSVKQEINNHRTCWAKPLHTKQQKMFGRQ
jgi:hypothetical protein